MTSGQDKQRKRKGRWPPARGKILGSHPLAASQTFWDRHVVRWHFAHGPRVASVAQARLHRCRDPFQNSLAWGDVIDSDMPGGAGAAPHRGQFWPAKNRRSQSVPARRLREKRRIIKKDTDGYRARLEQVARARRSHPQTLNCAARQLTQGPHASTTSASLRWDRPSANGLSGNIGSMLWFDRDLQRTCCPWQRGCPWRRTDADCVAASTFAVEIDSGKSPQGAPKSSLRDQWVRGAIGDELTLRFFEGARKLYSKTLYLS